MSNNKTTEACLYRATAGALVIPESRRTGTLAREFGGRHCFTVESTVFAMAHRNLPEYRGGYWDFIKLKGGGFYMSLQSTDGDDWKVQIREGNDYSGEMSGDAAGIVVCMLVYSRLSFSLEGRAADRIVEHFEKLRDYLSDHPEAAEIFAAID